MKTTRSKTRKLKKGKAKRTSRKPHRTTIGDLIVAFPRTRDVLMKHGLRFDVEQAGYLYMTLSVFSAIHGLTTNNLVQELHLASKDPPPQPSAQQLRPIPAATNV